MSKELIGYIEKEQWQTVAEGISLSELAATVEDMELPKGTKMKMVMETPVSWAFSLAGAELAFRPFMPEGVTLEDVYGEEGQGIVDMEVDPAWLVPVLAFIGRHWLAITIAGFVLAAIITFVTVMIKLPAGLKIPMSLIIGGAIGVTVTIVGLAVLSRHSPGRRK